MFLALKTESSGHLHFQDEPMSENNNQAQSPLRKTLIDGMLVLPAVFLPSGFQLLDHISL